MLTVVTGPPCAGKSTYVREHAEPGDIRIDFDTIATALGCTTPHGYGDRDPIWHVTLAARNAAIDAGLEQHKLGARVWIVDCVIPAYRRRRYIAAGASIISLVKVGRAELHRRADADGRPSAWHQRIDQWLATDGKPVTHRDPHSVSRTRW